MSLSKSDLEKISKALAMSLEMAQMLEYKAVFVDIAKALKTVDNKIIARNKKERQARQREIDKLIAETDRLLNRVS
jgi:hypothetical protein